ncbi:neprilysin-2-like [Venturia canescens]|uniref:neprilysin-2-like n=1 Tax=Venturia canescens TaxID=32260 RepID=UPI001C9BD127|nr:neprilysin-2-like [Venturia canescens]
MTCKNEWINEDAGESEIIVILDRHKDLCLTPECIHTASALLKNMDKDVDPCENFHRYACGGFINNTIIPDDKSGINNQEILTRRVLQRLKFKIQAEVEGDEPSHFKLVKIFYQNCLKKNTTATSAFELLRNQVDKLGGWPVLLGDAWTEDQFVWTDAIKKFRNAGYYYTALTSFKIHEDMMNSTKRIIYISGPGFGIDRQYLSEGFDNSAVRDYKKKMVDIAVKLGGNELQAQKELNNSLTFEIKLAKFISQDMWERYNLTTLTNLSSAHPSMPWEEYIKGILPSSVTIGQDEKLVNEGQAVYFNLLEKLLSETKNRDLANYLMWRVIWDFVNNFVDDKDEGGNIDSTTRSNECTQAVYDKFPIIAGAIFVKHYFDKNVKKKAMELMSDLKDQVQILIQNADWVDEKTRVIMMEKAVGMVSHVSYPDELLDDAKLEKIYEGLNFSGNTYIEGLVKVKKFEDDLYWGKLNKPVNRSDWMDAGGSAIVETFHYPMNNRVLIPAGMLQGPYFNADRPNYMNYGSMGFIMGHEITHGYDDAGKLFDKNGEYVRWGEKANKNWASSYRCLKNQYGKYTVPELGIKLDAERTVAEDFSDNGGAKIAYLAYSTWAAKNEAEKKLPGIDLTPKQMFWLSIANAFCAKYTPEGLRTRIKNHPHSPEEYQIIGSFSNMPEFAADFNCSKHSRMNPQKRCLVW